MTVDVLWFLLLPLVFGLGWFAARWDRRSEHGNADLTHAYFKGLNFLLNEQPDKAIDAFVEVVRIDPETVELHFALGSLFRRRGETERALRVHQNLAERTDLSASQREHALFELGQDYLRAGLLDRAEDAFNRLAGSEYRVAALGHRLRIAQMVRDWPLAIELAAQQGRESTDAPQSVITHFHCEQALAALEQVRKGGVQSSEDTQHLLAAKDKVAMAAAADPDHPRPLLMQGELAMARGDAGEAIDAWSEMIARAPRHVALVAAPFLEAHGQVGRLDEGIARLESVNQQHPSVDVLAALHQAVLGRDGPQAARTYLEAALKASPSLLGLGQWLVALRQTEGSERAQADVQLAQQQIKRQSDRLSRYVCRDCGFTARRFYWQCPGCNQWDSYSPRRVEEL